MKAVVIESPFAGRGENPISRWLDGRLNLAYARRCLAHSVALGESPYASHLLLTQILDDRDQHEREMGIACGIDMHHRCDAVAFYIDRGWSRGMTAALKHAREIGAVIEHRMLAMTTPVSIEWPAAHFNRPPPPEPVRAFPR